ncbi:hypothetical protein HC256_002668 [Beauveria bassiana]|nr:hypothetical protein HC256_002668 [Beauveria bassiana]
MSSASVFISFLRSVATDTFTSDSMAHLGVGLPACDLGMTQYRFGRAGWVGHCTQHNWYTPTEQVGKPVVVEVRWIVVQEQPPALSTPLARQFWLALVLSLASSRVRAPPASSCWHTVLRNAATTQPGGQDVASNDLLVGCYIETYL